MPARRNPKAAPQLESLEARNLLNGSAGLWPFPEGFDEDQLLAWARASVERARAENPNYDPDFDVANLADDPNTPDNEDDAHDVIDNALVIPADNDNGCTHIGPDRLGDLDLGDYDAIIYIGGNGNNKVINESGLPLIALERDGNNFVIGGSDDDVIVGGPGNDRLFGRGGSDVLVGDWTDDRGGNDLLAGGSNIDALLGGPGNDRFALDPDNSDDNPDNDDILIDFGRGHDHTMDQFPHDYLPPGLECGDREGPPPLSRPAAVGMYDPTGRAVGAGPGLVWFLRSAVGAGEPDEGRFAYGGVGWFGVVGDWDGDGQDTVGVVDVTGASSPGGAVWYLRNTNGPGAPDYEPFVFGLPGWQPVVGDWDGDGVDGIGMYDPATSTFYLRQSPDGLAGPDIVLDFGLPGWQPMVGDWDGDGVDTIGLVDPHTGTWYLAGANAQGTALQATFAYGAPGWEFVTGDWDGDGITTPGVVDDGARWYLRNRNSAGAPDVPVFAYGLGSWAPLGAHFSPPGLTLRDASPPAALTGPVPALTEGQLQSVVGVALNRLAAAGAAPTLVASLTEADYTVAPLPPGVLGLADTQHQRVLLDDDGAGHGWLVAPTPGSGEELPSGAVQGRMDLLTAVLHEMGHLAGHHDGEDGLMAGLLEPGTRHIEDLDAVFSLR